MMGEEKILLGIYKFDGMDFAFWRMQIENYLYSKKLNHPLLNEKTEEKKDDE